MQISDNIIMTLTSRANIQILKKPTEVYNTIINPSHLTQFFISESSGPLETGKEVLWKFPEFDDRFPITQVKTETNKSISFVWDPDTVVTIKLEAFKDHSTVVHVTEGPKELSDDNLNWLISNTGGWSNFLACMKAYMEYGVGLRKGAYDFMKP